MPVLIKKIRFSFRLITAFWQAHKKTILFAFALGLLIAALLPQATNRLLLNQKTIKIGLVGKYTFANLPSEITHKISQGLTTINPDGSANPALASSWEVKDNGKRYLFTLKENLFWHDETPLIAADINYNFSDVYINPLDDQTLEFVLKESFSPFPTVVSQAVFKTGHIGVGDYQLESIQRNGQIVEKIVLVPVSPGQPKIIYKFYPTQSALITSLKLGEINQITQISQIEKIKDWPNLEIKPQVRKNQFTALIFNTQNPALGSKSIRQGLAYALKKDYPARALGPISPSSWAYNPNLKAYEFDLARAQNLFEKGLDEISQAEIKLQIATFPDLYPVAEEIASDWQELGVETQIQVVDVVPQDFEVFLVTEDVPLDPDQYLLWHSTQPNNLSRFRSPQIDKLLEDGRKTLDQEERKEIYRDFQRFLVEDAPVVFLYHPTVYTVRRK